MAIPLLSIHSHIVHNYIACEVCVGNKLIFFKYPVTENTSLQVFEVNIRVE